MTVAVTPTRAARAAVLRWRMVVNRGDAVVCPLCGHHFARFRDDWNRPNALCWRCGSHERHRAQWLYLRRLRPELLAGAASLLHFAPEWCLEGRLRAAAGPGYVTADLRPGLAERTLDITRLALADGVFDAIICSHVLEHVQDDAAAMRELRRVLSPDGWALIMVPIDLTREHTYEDPAIVSPEERRRAYWQSDHVRLYAPDIERRLSAAGFTVTVENVARELGPERSARYGLLTADLIFLCRPTPA